MIYTVYDKDMNPPEVASLKLVANGNISGYQDVSVVVVDNLGEVRPGGYICTFQQSGKLFLVSQVGTGFGFKLDEFRRIVVT